MRAASPRARLIGGIPSTRVEGRPRNIDVRRTQWLISAQAKMSGTGRGGLMIALTPTEEVEDAVKKALEGLAPQVWTTFLA